MTRDFRAEAERIVRTVREAGHEAYFAGGCVRDMVMGIEPHDYDVATSARPEEVTALFPKTSTVGAAFGVAVGVAVGAAVGAGVSEDMFILMTRL